MRIFRLAIHFTFLKTGKKLKRKSWTELPMTEYVIRSVKRIGEKEISKSKKHAIGDDKNFRDRERIEIGKIVKESPEPSTPEVNEEEVTVTDEELYYLDTESVDGDVNQNNKEGVSILGYSDITESMNVLKRISEEIDDSSDPSEQS